MPNIFNVGTFFVLFREALECAIIVGVLLNYIKKTLPHEPDEQKRLRKQVWLGSAAGLAVSLVIGIVITVVFYVLRHDVFASMEALWEGVMKSLAVILITWMAFGMIRAKNWYQKWEAKLEGKLAHQAKKDADIVDGKAVEIEDSDVKNTIGEPSSAVVMVHDSTLTKGKDVEDGSLLSQDSTAVASEDVPDFKGGLSTRPRALFFMAFTIVIREGLESVIFLTGVGQGEPLAMILPGILGIAVGLGLGFFIYKTAAKFRLNLFLVISAVCLFFIAAGLAAGAAHEFEETYFSRRNAGIMAEWNATAPQNLTVAESPANVWKSLRVRGLERQTEETVVDVAWSPPVRENMASPDCPPLNGVARTNCTVRTYYIAAENTTWDYAPSGYNHMSGVPFVRDQEGPGTWTLHGEDRIGAVYDKVSFVEYEDAGYTRRKAKEGPWLGFLGPFIRAEVGDIVKIHFVNRAHFTASMHPHGLHYVVGDEGAKVEWNDVGNSVEPNGVYTYTWVAKESSGPTASEGNVAFWAYHSHVHEVHDIFTGLIGPLAVYLPGTLDPVTDKPTDVDREYPALFMVVDENQSLMLESNIEKYTPALFNNPDAWTTDEFVEMNLMHSVNGRMYNNLDGFEMVVGERVRWFVFAFGNEVDLHTAHWHGNTLVEAATKHRTDVVPLLPASFHVGVMNVSSAGQWLLHCHVSDHIHAGMIASYHVKANASEPDITWNVQVAEKEYFPELPETSTILWDVSACCSENDNPFFQILNALVGWMAVATVATVTTYFVYWAVVIAGCVFLWYMERRRALAAKAKSEAALEAGQALVSGKAAIEAADGIGSSASSLSAPASTAVPLDFEERLPTLAASSDDLQSDAVELSGKERR